MYNVHVNIWHDISDSRITPEEFITVLEISRGSRKKYELDTETGMLALDRIPPTGMYFPVNYGFIPRTLCEDGDALDVCVLCSEVLDPMTLVNCRPIGCFVMTDCGEGDEKIIAVPIKDPKFANVKDIGDLAANYVDEIMTFYKYYKSHDPKNVIELKPAEGRTRALAMIKDAKELYAKKFGGKK